ncbi:hypothetical protein H2200_000263 [Cladophialophora chaetospira]|uniref:Zn(2)-C6 fungal-type domain-containing protein n=1 Tax=Cladophialophora chaetospira TaxID=386627 RepID=A0AA38XP52_9EURO|nr:hypothetical protein H2200_000263 [Cladophialophora chaetospira]
MDTGDSPATAIAAPDASVRAEEPSITSSGNNGTKVTTTLSQGSIAQSADAEQPLRKRRRIAHACNPCRDRKMRCDGKRPMCTGCVKRWRGHLCVYEPSNFLKPGQVDLVAARKCLLPKGSYALSTEQDSDKIEPASSSSEQRNVDPLGLASAVAEPARWNLLAGTSDEAHRATVGGLPETPLSCESLPADALTVVPNGKGLATYGGSSAIALTTSLVQTLNSMHDSAKPPRLLFLVDEKTISQQKLRHQPRSASHQPFALPTRSAADRYVKSFFEFVHPIFPVLHRPSFYERYYRFWTGETESSIDDDHADSDSSIFLSTTHMIFALGCLYSDANATESRNGVANQFYQSSRKVFSSDAVDNMPFAGIQLLLLQAVYLQSTAYANRCWNIIGAAIRGAQSLGLHVDSVDVARGGQLQREMRRRVWHACIIFDRLLALVFNRPVMIQATSESPLPQAIDDEYLLETTEGTQPASQESRMNLFIFSIKLWNILHDILSTFYSGSRNSCFVDEVEVHGWSTTWLYDLLKLDNALDDLQSSLPESLKLEKLEAAALQVQDSDRLQIYVFHSRFLYIRALLLRPVLLVMTHHWRDFNIGSSKSASLQQDVMIRICAHCVSTVTELVDLKYRGLQDSYSGPPWNTVHYIFVAAIAIATAQLCPIADPVFQQSALKETWDRCISILEHLKAEVEAATTALHVLSIVGKRICSLQTHNIQGEDPSTLPQVQNESSSEPAHAHHSTQAEFLLETPDLHEGIGEPFGDAWLSMEMNNLDWFDIEL